MNTPNKELPVERFVAENVTEAIWLRFKRLSSEQLCRQVIAKNNPTFSSDVIDVKASGMSSAVRSALGYWETQQGCLNSKILSRYYAILQITIAEQIASSDPAANLSTAQKHTENGHGLYTLNVAGNSFLESYLVGCLKSGHFPAYQHSLGHDISAYATDRRPRKIDDVDMNKVISLGDLIRRVPEFQEIVKEYIGKDPLSFHIGHASKNMVLRSQQMRSHAEKTGQVLLNPPQEEQNITTYVAFYPHDSSVSAEELNGYGFEITNIHPEAAATKFDTDHFVGEITHPQDTYWWQYVESYKSGYCGTSVIVPFWGMKDAFVLHFTILYAFSIVVRYLPETWHEVEHGKLNHISALLEHYLVILDNVLPKLVVERLTRTRLMVTQPGGLNAPV
jgi:hypothetical protein